MKGKRETPSPASQEALLQLARETGAWLGQLGVRPDDDRWIATHSETLESLFRADRARGSGRAWLYRLARRAARTAR